jgi:dimethylargininase
MDIPATPPAARRIALVRRPADNLAEGQLTHIGRVPVDLGLARTQWDGYVAALAAEGWTIVEVEPAPLLPDSVFIEDAGISFDDFFVLTSPGAPTRRDETAGAQAAVSALGIPVFTLVLPGTLDGGDVLKIGRTVYVGRSLRTNDAGIDQLREILAPRGYSVVTVPISRVLHLKSAVTALPDGTVIGYPPLVDDPTLFDAFLPVPEEYGTAVVLLAPDALLMSSAAPRSAALFTARGYRVVTVDISEFEKLEGCVTCLSVRIR